MAKNVSYNWIKRLVNKITSTETSNNESFNFYGHHVVLMSGTVDYVSITVYEGSDAYSDVLLDGSFDYWTKKLNVEYAKSDAVEQVFENALRSIYSDLSVNYVTEREQEIQENIEIILANGEDETDSDFVCHTINLCGGNDAYQSYLQKFSKK